MPKAIFSITRKDLRIAKISRMATIQPCTLELESYLEAVDRYGSGDHGAVAAFAATLATCMDNRVSVRIYVVYTYVIE